MWDKIQAPLNLVPIISKPCAFNKVHDHCQSQECYSSQIMQHFWSCVESNFSTHIDSGMPKVCWVSTKHSNHLLELWANSGLWIYFLYSWDLVHEENNTVIAASLIRLHGSPTPNKFGCNCTQIAFLFELYLNYVERRASFFLAGTALRSTVQCSMNSSPNTMLKGKKCSYSVIVTGK